MIVPKKDQKTYGVLHTENYFSFTGFCKKVSSDEIQKIDVYLDNKLIDTILADKNIQRIEDIYDNEGFGFEYNLPEEYIGKKASIKFKNHETQEDLNNSPYLLIDESNEDFNEIKFLYSLNNINLKEMKNLYSPNVIGFLATEETLNDENFIKYLQEVIIRFPDLKIKGFCFNNKQKDIIKTIFKNKVDFDIINNIKTLINNIEIFIFNNVKSLELRNTFIFIKYYCESIGTIQFSQNMDRLLVSSEILTHPSISNIELYGFNKNQLNKYNNNFYRLVYSKYFNKSYNDNMNLHTLLNLESILCFLKDKQFKRYMNKINKITMNILNIKI